MKTVNRVISIFVAVLLVLSMVACGTTPSTQTKAPSTVSPSASSDASAPAKTVEISLAHNIVVGGTDDLSAIKFAELVSEKSGGTIKVTVYGGGQLGGERDMIEGLQLGSIDMCLATSAYLANICPQFGLLDLPFLFNDVDDVKAKLEGEAGVYLRDKLLEEENIRVLDYWNSGFRVMLTAEQKIESIADLKGLGMRAPEVDVYIDMFKALGANPTPVPFGEVYTSIETGVVKGVEVCAEEMYAMNFHEVGKYIAITNHIFSTMTLVISENVFQKLSEEQQKIIVEAANEVTEWQWDAFNEADIHALAEMEASGIEITHPERGPMIEACKTMQDTYAEKYGAADLLAMLRK